MATKEPDAVSRKRIRGEADIRGQSIQARLRLESEEVEKSTLIREWQDKTVEQPSVGSGGVISRLFNGCVSLLRSILKFSKGKDGLHGDHTQLQESLIALILWSEDHHLSTGNLDTQLHDSEDLRELICSLLLSLADLLVNGLLQHIITSPAERHAMLFKYNILSLMHEARNETGIVETPVDYTRDNVSNMAATLATLADCLIALSPSEQSAKDDSNQHSGHYTMIEDRPPYLYHVELIRSKFANASPSLLERLGKCNWERYLRLQERRETTKDEEHLRSEEMESKSRFYDSALGTSMPAQSELGSSVSTYAETVVSSRAASSHQKLPKLPIEGRMGKKFICQVCNRVVAIQYSRDWKKHIFQDLLAYTCIYEGCLGLSLWEDRHAMTNHLAVEHGLGPEWKNHPCPLCRHHTGEGKELISLHVSRHMEEIALNALPSGYESDSESEANSMVTDSSHSTSNQEDGSWLPESDHSPRHNDPPSPPPFGPQDSTRTRTRRAPVSHPNPLSVSGMPDSMAAAPTKGFPWAFSDPDEDKRDSFNSEEERSRHSSEGEDTEKVEEESAAHRTLQMLMSTPQIIQIQAVPVTREKRPKPDLINQHGSPVGAMQGTPIMPGDGRMAPNLTHDQMLRIHQMRRNQLAQQQEQQQKQQGMAGSPQNMTLEQMQILRQQHLQAQAQAQAQAQEQMAQHSNQGSNNGTPTSYNAQLAQKMRQQTSQSTYPSPSQQSPSNHQAMMGANGGTDAIDAQMRISPPSWLASMGDQKQQAQSQQQQNMMSRDASMGDHRATAADPTAPIRNLSQSLPPPLSAINGQTGISPPSWLASMGDQQQQAQSQQPQLPESDSGAELGDDYEAEVVQALTSAGEEGMHEASEDADTDNADVSIKETPTHSIQSGEPLDPAHPPSVPSHSSSACGPELAVPYQTHHPYRVSFPQSPPPSQLDLRLRLQDPVDLRQLKDRGTDASWSTHRGAKHPDDKDLMSQLQGRGPALPPIHPPISEPTLPRSEDRTIRVLGVHSMLNPSGDRSPEAKYEPFLERPPTPDPRQYVIERSKHPGDGSPYMNG